MSGTRAAGLVLLTRAECELCEQMLYDLTRLGQQHSLPAVELRDVDSDPDLQRRYGQKIPVLLIDGTPVCSGRLDPAELLRLMKS